MKRDERIQLLIRKYREGIASDEDIQMIENYLEMGTMSLDEFDDIRVLEKNIDRLNTPEPSLDLDSRFHQMLIRERNSTSSRDWFSFEFLMPRLAFAAVTFLAGLVLGYFIFQRPQETDVDALTMEVRNLRETMMLSMLENESATERLKAVSLTSGLNTSGKIVTDALLRTLNRDENVNVRLAALEAIKPYCTDSAIRQELIHSISQQQSPLVQIALAELMAGLNEKSSLPEFEKIIGDEDTPTEVKQRIRQNLQALI